MFIFLALGALIGALSVIFFLQNTEPITVIFLNWQLEGLLGIILALAFAGGVMMTALFSLPSLISDWIESTQLRRRIKLLEDNLAEAKKREEGTKFVVQSNLEDNQTESYKASN